MRDRERQVLIAMLTIFIGSTIAMGIAFYMVHSFQRNTQRPVAQEWYQHEQIIGPQRPLEAKMGGYNPVKVVTPVQNDMATQLEPVCRHSAYSETGPGIAVQWEIGEGGFTAPWTPVKLKWSCNQ